MSTLSGVPNKGEKGKSKFQSLDINSLYKASRGESLENHQHKNISSRRHGMQTLGKIPSARRAPANLPSLKSEYSGNDPAINLVPCGGSGWGNKPGETGPPPSTTQVATTTTVTVTTVASTPDTSVATAVIIPPTQNTSPISQTVTSTSHSDKSWSSVTSSSTEATPIYLAHQSPYFQQEFPSLSREANAASGPNKPEASHLPGPSLRPQTEGSWMQGGSRPQGQTGVGVGSQLVTVPAQGPLSHHPQGLDLGGGRNNLAPSGVGVGLVGHIPPAGIPPHHYRLMPQFMIRHNHPAGGFPPNYHGPPRLRFPYSPDTRLVQGNKGLLNINQEEVATRPIIKEEDLKVMDDITEDSGWAAHDEIDYNQTLSFSDEEGALDDKLKIKKFVNAVHAVEHKDIEDNYSGNEDIAKDCEEKLKQENSREMLVLSQNENRDPQRVWHQPRSSDLKQAIYAPSAHPMQPVRAPSHQSGKQGEDEDVWRERRRLQNEEIAIAVERARQRKEEEEKRYEETKQAAAKKLHLLEEKLRAKVNLDKDDVLTSHSNVQHVPSVLLPDWEKDKDKSLLKNHSENKGDMPLQEVVDNIDTLQVENKCGNDKERDRERDVWPEREVAQPFSRQFQSNLPPRFQKQSTEKPPSNYRLSSGESSQLSSSGQPFCDNRWPVNTHFGGSKNYRNRNDSDLSEKEKEESKDGTVLEKTVADSCFDNHEKDRFEGSFDTNEFNGENDKTFKYYSDGREKEEVSTAEIFKTISLNKGDSFKEKEFNDRSMEIDKRETLLKAELKDRPDRPHKPDSRDSRTIRDSHVYRDSSRDEIKKLEENVIQVPLPWAERNFEVEHKTENYKKDVRDDCEFRRDSHVMSYHQRHIPGPITKEKLEASELKSESGNSLNLVPLIRSDKKLEVKKPDNQWEILHGGSPIGAWQQSSAATSQGGKASSESWTDLSGTNAPITKPFVEQIDKSHKDQSELSFTKVEFEDNSQKKDGAKEREVETSLKSAQPREKIGRGGNRGMRFESRGMRVGWNNGNFYRGGASPWRGEARGRKYQQRRSNSGHECTQHSESEASAEEVSSSIESGKEDKRLDQDRKHLTRSVKQGSKKFDRDEKTKDNRKTEGDKEVFSNENDSRRYDKKPMYEGARLRGNFEPRGEPSRRGRGAPFRSKGSSANVGRRMDGYGPPSSKRPFTSESSNQVQEEKKIVINDFSQTSNINEDKSAMNMSHDDKTKMNQQQLTAGIIGNSARFSYKSQPPNLPPRMRRKSESEKRGGKARDSMKRESTMIGSGSGGEVDENWETTSETSEHDENEQDCVDNRQQESLQKVFGQNQNFPRGHPRRQPQSNSSAGREKRGGFGSFDRDNYRKPVYNSGPQSVTNGSSKAPCIKPADSFKEQVEIKATDQSVDKKQLRTDKEKRNNLDRIDLCNTASVVVIDDQLEGAFEEDHTVFSSDNNGFQEVRSKKNVKDANRQTKEEPLKNSKERSKPSKPQSPGPSTTPVVTSATTNKGVFDRPRVGKLPPRFAKLRENTRLQKMTLVQDTNEVNKLNPGNTSGFLNKDLTSPAPPPPVNAWDKPITATLRTATPPTSSTTNSVTCLDDSSNVEAIDHLNSNTSSQRSSPNEDKAVIKPTREPTGNDMLDGSSPPVQTIIFENTNYKSTPIDASVKSKYTGHIKNQRPEKCKERKMEDDNSGLGFNAPGPEITMQETKAEPIQMPISFNKNEDTADMKLDFRFDSDLAQLTDDKTNKSIAAIQMTRSIQIAAQTSAAELQFKLASVKKVWENSPAALENGGDEAGTVSSSASYTPTFSNSVEDPSNYTSKAGVDPSIGDDSSSLTPEGVYNAGQQLSNSSNTYNGSTVQSMIKADPSSNVCKVKPQPQAAMLPHSGPLSPPSGPFTSSPAQPNLHISYQPAAQYGGIPAIPSPPTVYTPQPELYPTFQINSPQVIGSQVQGRSQFSQFAPYLSQSLGQQSAFSQQSLYHVQPPNAAPPTPHDIFQSQLSQYRIQPPTYGASQQLSNNPNTVLISSSNNSLMSANVKPSPGTIGSKTASYQPQNQPPHSQLYIYSDPQMLSQSPYLQNSQLVQRPSSNVVPTMPPSSASYYSTSAGGGGATGYYQPGNSGLQAAAANMHQPTFGIPTFNTQSPAATPAGMGSFGSNMAQQYRSTPPLTAADHQDVFSVFSPVAQINSSKSRGSSGKPGSYNSASQQQPSPTQTHKFTAFQQNVSPTTQLMIQQQQQQQGSMSLRASPRYPTPIQRPINYQSVGCQRFSARFKLPPPSNTASATSASTYYVTQNNPTKLENTDLDSKSEAAITTDCNKSSPVKLNKSASITKDDETTN